MDVEKIMSNVFSKLEGDLSGKYYSMKNMSKKEKERLIDEHFLFVDDDPSLKTVGMYNDWPNGRGIFHNKEKTFLVWVNEEDQLRIISMQKRRKCIRGCF